MVLLNFLSLNHNFLLAGNDADDDSDGSESDREDGLDIKGMFDECST